MTSGIKGVLISDFSINNLAGYLSNNSIEQPVKCFIAPFNQVHHTLIDANLECWKHQSDFAVVWTLPERILKNFAALLNYENFDFADLKKEVEEFTSLIINASSRVKLTFVATWSIDTTQQNYGILTTKPDTGIINVLAQINLLLAEKFWDQPNIYLLDSNKWNMRASNNAYNPKLWYLNKTPFNNMVFADAAKDIMSSIKSIQGKNKKLIIVDLDNTLWGGIVGDIGYENIKLGGHDPEGEAYKDFQFALKMLKNKGVLLAIVSKNEERVALLAIEKKSEMVLVKKDFVSWRINWEDKAKNIVELANELNLGLDSIVFIDDNAHEREWVKSALPEIFVPEMPSDPLLYRQFLLNLDCFNNFISTKEDKYRTKLYAEEKQRTENIKTISNLEEWLKSIDIKITIEKTNEGNFQRVLQLLNKTNQLNLQTRRFTERELITWISSDENSMFAFSVTDKFGDAGLTGIIGVTCKDGQATITDFVLSCRVIGRKAEEIMLYAAIEHAKNKFCKIVNATFIATEKNKPCYDFFKRSGFIEKENNFTWDASKTYAIPSYVTLILKEY